MRALQKGFVTLAAALALAAAAGAQTAAIGLSTVRAQRFGNDNLQGFYTPQTTDLFAYALAAGDFNGDGADDLATGVPFDNGLAASPVNDSGSVVVRYSSPGSGLTNNPSQVYLRQTADHDPAEAGDEYGTRLGACDFNGDRFDDLVVGIPYEDHLETDGGAVQVYYGSSSGVTPANSRFFAESTPGVPGDVEPYDMFGWSLACGDFNGDGYDDLVVGVPYEDFHDAGPLNCGGTCDYDFSKGMIDIIPGTPQGLDFAAASELDQDVAGMNGEAEPWDLFGWSLAAGDFNADGYDDLAIGVPGEDNDEGQVQVVFGGPPGLTSTGNLFWSETFIGGLSEEGDRFSETLAAGDFDHDGFADLAIGIPYEDFGPSNPNTGQVNVLYGAPGGFDRSRTQFWAENSVNGAGASEPNDSFGYSLAVGDFDKDGFADLCIGHPAESVAGAQDGAVTILMGSAAGLTASRHREIVAGVEGFPGDLNQHGKYFGYSLATGDFDGDGHADLVLGSPWEDEGGIADVGAETVLYGALFGDGFETGSTAFWSQNVSSLYFNKAQATAAARLGPLASKVGLQVDLFNPTLQRPATATYVRVGPDRGFNNERTLKATFFIDPQGLTMSNLFQLMAFTDGVGTGSKARLSFDLTQNASIGGYAIIANYWNDNVGALQFAASAFFAAVGDANGHNNRIDFEWTAGNPGHLTMWRTRYLSGAPDANGRVLMFSVDLPGSQFAVINDVLAGMISGQRAGTYGSLYLDELSFRR